jgi:MFS family permease
VGDYQYTNYHNKKISTKIILTCVYLATMRRSFNLPVLPVIILAQFCCTSLWFAGNAIMPELLKQFNLPVSYLAHLTTAVQLGFITGSLLIAITMIADRFSPSRIFFICAILAALVNLGMLLQQVPVSLLLSCRFLTGLFLAGIYPVGMKIAADHYEASLGKALGWLVGALVLGTAFPHILKSFTQQLPIKYFVFATSLLAATGGILLLAMVPDGPYRRPGTRLNMKLFAQAFRNPQFRAAAGGYFGHMWELYAFWAFVPLLFQTYNDHHTGMITDISLASFLVIASGAVACVISGWLSQSIGAKPIAAIALLVSGICCLISPLAFQSRPAVFIMFMFCWGMSVIADSPLFSTLVARNATPDVRGSALTIVNCIGFSITVVSIQLLNKLITAVAPEQRYLLLAVGPALGLFALLKKRS